MKYVTYTLIAIALVALCLYVVNGMVSETQYRAIYPDTIVQPVVPSETDIPVDTIQDPDAPVQSDDMGLEGKQFRLVSYNGTPVPVAALYTLSFTNGNLGAKFCNGMGGSYTVKGPVIAAPELVSTMMYCGEPANLMTMEGGFGTALRDGAIITMADTTLTIKHPAHTFVYTEVKN